MTNTRLEAFSDGVLAIIITIMVLELKAPHGTTLQEIKPLFPVLISYVLSFLFVGVYWGNHHHLLHLAKHFSTQIMLANLNLLFWLSLVPFATGWMGENNFAPITVAIYALLLCFCGISFNVLQKIIVSNHKESKEINLILKSQSKKGILSVVLYLCAIPIAYLSPYLSILIFFIVAIKWLIPDKKIETIKTN